MAVRVEQFLKNLAASSLFAAEELDALEKSLPDRRGQDAQELAREMIRGKKLTPWQASAIYQGKPHGLIFGNYVVLDKLGQGGMGMVFKAEHRRMKRIVALKVMSGPAMKSPDAVRRFHREVEAAARLTHPHIVAAFDADEAKGTHFLVMEYVAGHDLASLVKKQGPLPVEQAVSCIVQAARGIAHAHESGVVHRDVKPSNLLLDGQGTVKILDMGLARIDDALAAGAPRAPASAASLTQSGSIMGTIDYMSPEQALDTKTADQRSDIYSLGCTLWFLLTGKAMFAGETLMAKLLAHRDQPIPSLLDVLGQPGTSAVDPVQLDAVFRRMVAKKPNDRYQTMLEVLDDLESGAMPVRSRAAAAVAASAEPAGDDQMLEFLRAISPESSATALRTAVQPAAVETQVAQAAIETQTSFLEVSLQKLTALTPLQRFWIAAVVVGAVVAAGAALLLRGGKPRTDQSGTPASEKTSSGKSAARSTSPAEKKEKKAAAAEAAWVSLFNGRDLGNWTTLKGGPAPWKIENGYFEVVPLTGPIMTREKFGPDVELHVEFWLPLMTGRTGQFRANSGIYLAGRHEIQILDMVDNAGVQPLYGCGALYGIIAPKPGGIRPPETWQTFDIRYEAPRRQENGNGLVPGRLTVVHNDVPVIENRLIESAALPGAVDQDVGTPGPVMLQDHQSPIRFRNLKVRPLPPRWNLKSADGFVELFDGRDLAGWTPQGQGDWRITEGTLVGAVSGRGWLMSDREYGDFEIELEYRLASGANSGVFLRAWPEGNVDGGQFLEIQLSDDEAPANRNAAPFVKTGAIFGTAAPKPVPQAPANVWNRLGIRAVERKVAVKINGKQVLDVDLDDYAANFARFPGLQRTRGHIGLQTYESLAEFRKIRIREL